MPAVLMQLRVRNLASKDALHIRRGVGDWKGNGNGVEVCRVLLHFTVNDTSSGQVGNLPSTCPIPHAVWGNPSKGLKESCELQTQHPLPALAVEADLHPARSGSCGSSLQDTTTVSLIAQWRIAPARRCPAHARRDRGRRS